ESMHAHALTSPLTIVQTNLDARLTLAGTPSPDPRMICINCHAPTGAAQIESATLPLPGAVPNEGISCVGCHQHAGDTEPGSGGFASKFQAQLGTSRTYFGQYADAVGNAFHK